METSIYGIPYSFKDPMTEKALKRVLDKIHKDYPIDFKYIKKKLLFINTVSEKAFETGVGGGWYTDITADMNYMDQFKVKGILYLPDGLGYSLSDLTAIIAHEMGHVCTRFGDVKSRTTFILLDAISLLLDIPLSENVAKREITVEQAAAIDLEQEWAMELSADSYAVKWGFKEELVLARISSSSDDDSKLNLVGGMYPLANSLVLLTYKDKSIGMTVSSSHRLRRINTMPKDLSKFEYTMSLSVETLFSYIMFKNECKEMFCVEK